MPLTRPHFDAPPLVEAVFDCFVEPGANVTDLRALEDTFFARFPEFIAETRQEWQRFEARLEMKEGQPTGSAFDVKQAGVRRWNAAKTRGVLIGPSVLAMNVVPPYGHFEDHAPQLRALLDGFLATAAPNRIEWLGHRYINQVQIALADQKSPADLFRLYPSLPKPRALTHPAVTVQVETSRFQESVVLTTLNLSAKTPDSAIYTLDVYARTVGSVPSTSSSMTDWHASAHEAVVDAFLAGITAEARRLFKERPS